MANYPIRLRASLDEQGALIKALLTHPMENGFAKDEDGTLIPAHFITQVTLFVNDQPAATVLTGSGVAADPLFSWRIADVKPGDRVRVAWRDNQGDENEKQTVVEAPVKAEAAGNP